MLNLLGKSWGREIADVSAQAGLQPATVRVELKQSPEDLGRYDFDTQSYPDAKPPTVIYEGRARFAPIRWGVDARNTHVFNSSTTTRLRVQFPYGAMPDDVMAGTRIWIVEAEFAPHMVGGCAIVTGDVMNSDNAARTLEAEWNSDDGVNEDG